MCQSIDVACNITVVYLHILKFDISCCFADFYLRDLVLLMSVVLQDIDNLVSV